MDTPDLSNIVIAGISTITILITIIVLYLFAGPYHQIYSCEVIDKPGNYLLADDLRGSPTEAQQVTKDASSTACIVIKSSDVTLDCDNRTIINGLEGYRGTIGIAIENVSNVEIKNCVVGFYWSGIYAYGADRININNNIIMSNSHDGIGLKSTNNSVVKNNLIGYSKDNGVGISEGWNETIASNQFYAGEHGVDCSPCFNSTISNNSFRGIEKIVYFETKITDESMSVKEHIAKMNVKAENNSVG